MNKNNENDLIRIKEIFELNSVDEINGLLKNGTGKTLNDICDIFFVSPDMQHAIVFIDDYSKLIWGEYELELQTIQQ